MKGRVGIPSDTYPDKDAWYRSADWDEAARALWAKKLVRAWPHNQIQYRRVKALALLASGDPIKEKAARDMLEFIVAARDAPHHEQVTALGILARHEKSGGQSAAAEKHFRGALAINGPDASGANGEEGIDLAEILIGKGDRESLRESRALLDRRATVPPHFVVSKFRLCVAQVRLSLALGDASGAAAWARSALEIAAVKSSGFRNHPTIGLVELDTPTKQWLERLARGP